jgi:spermidine/putrescine transport system permease protein
MRRWLGRNAIRIYAVIAFAYLFVPVAYTLAFSFNDSGKSNIAWRGFTLDKWKNPCGAPDVCPALGNSLKIGVLATLIATVLGTMIAFALARHRFRGRTATNLTIFLPMATPEVVLGASLLALFLNLKINLGFNTIVIAHVMFCISFVVVTVKARLAGFDRHLEEAAMDLGANPFSTFGRVTLPLIAPGIAAGALLAFALSVDDFVITLFNAGPTITFPLYVWGAARVGVPPQVNVIGTLIFLAAAGLMVVNVLSQITRSKGAT